MIVAIDGPAASGKGTVAAQLARHFDLAHLDTGLLYRAVGLAVAGNLDAPDIEKKAIAAARALDTSALASEALRTIDVSLAASRVARIEDVRAALRQYQQDFAHQPGGAVLDGRDIGTRICPDADVKLYITARPEARARRRTAQLRLQGLQADEEEILNQIRARDENDRSNPAGAFYLAKDAHLLDTTELDIEASLRAAVAIVDDVQARKADREQS